MSGGHFEYKQYEFGYVADSIEQIIHDYDNDKVTSWGTRVRNNYSDHEIDTFRQAVYFIRKAQVYAHRIDWLVSGDDGPDSFFSRLGEDLRDLDDHMKKVDKRNEKRRRNIGDSGRRMRRGDPGVHEDQEVRDPG